MRLLYLFVKDLSSGVSGETLSKKCQRDSVIIKLNQVSWKWKLCAWLFVISMNLGMLFYVYLFAMKQTETRQSAWLQSFIMWLLFDMLIAGTGVVLVTHLLIPLYVMSDIRTIKNKVLNDIIAFKNKIANRNGRKFEDILEPDVENSSTWEFNAAKYLFTSWRIASLCPEIPESEMILEFTTPWPKRSLKREKKKVSRTYERRYSFIIQAVSRVLIFFLTSLIHLPVMVQDMLIHFISNSGLGYVILLMLKLYRINIFLPLVPLIMLGVIIHFMVRSSAQNHYVPPTKNDSRTLKLETSTISSHPMISPSHISLNNSNTSSLGEAKTDPIPRNKVPSQSPELEEVDSVHSIVWDDDSPDSSDCVLEDL